MTFSKDERKILYTLISVLVLFQLTAYLIQVANNRKIVEEVVAEELLIGSQVFNRVLGYRNSQLNQLADVIVKDYGFLEAVTLDTKDTETIESMLENHGGRAGASMMILADLDNSVIAQTSKHFHITSQSLNDTIDRLSDHSDQINLIAINFTEDKQLNNALFQLVESRVNAPKHLANLVVGYEVDQKFLNEIRKITNLEFFFLMFDNHQQWHVLASTISQDATNGFLQQFDELDDKKIYTINTQTNDYLMTSMLFSKQNENKIYAVIGKPLSAVTAPYKRAENMLLTLLVLTLIASSVGVVLVTNYFVKPMTEEIYLDGLTGLGNRKLFLRVIERVFQNLNESNISFALLNLDLNNFKSINDTYGHDMGDLVLKTTSERLKKTIRSVDNIIRMGGDEFAIIIENCSEFDACRIAEKVSNVISQPIEMGAQKIDVKTSIGIAIANKGEENIETLMKKADLAMYESKSKQVSFCVYNN